MPTTFRPYQPDQLLLLSPDLREWLPPGHLAHHVSDLVDALELRAFYAPYEGDGRRNAPYDVDDGEVRFTTRRGCSPRAPLRGSLRRCGVSGAGGGQLPAAFCEFRSAQAGRLRDGGGAHQGVSRGPEGGWWRGRARSMAKRMNATARRCALIELPAQGEASGGDCGGECRLEAAQRAGNRAAIPREAGRTSGGEPEPKAQSNFTDPESR